MDIINYPFKGEPMDTCIRKWTWDRQFRIDRTSMKKGDSFGQPKTGVNKHIFTDGSYIHDKSTNTSVSGAGAYICGGYEAHAIKLGPYTTDIGEYLVLESSSR